MSRIISICYTVSIKKKKQHTGIRCIDQIYLTMIYYWVIFWIIQPPYELLMSKQADVTEKIPYHCQHLYHKLSIIWLFPMTLDKQLRGRVEYIRIFNEHPLPAFSPHHQSQSTHIHQQTCYANTDASSRNLKYHNNITARIYDLRSYHNQIVCTVESSYIKYE